jgi:hypothetical protein
MNAPFTVPADQLPDCLRRDNLTGPYFPGASRGMLAAVITLCVIFVLTSFNRLNHTDLWGHLDFGRWIVQHQALPAYDPFAAQPSQTPVLHAAWLSQVIGYCVQQTFGNEGLVFGHALLVTLAAGVSMLAVVRRGVPVHFAAVAGAGMFLLDLPIVGTIRPQLFGQLGAALVLLACVELPTRRHPLFWLPLVGMLWANLHGSILMGLAILGCYALGIAYQVLRDSGYTVTKSISDARLARALLALLLLLAGACINPHGPLLLPRILFFGEHAALSYISEWKSLAPNSLTGGLLIVSLIATACLWKLGARRFELHEFLLLALFALATLSAIRMMAWWAVVWPWVAVPHLAAAWEKFRRDRGIAEPPDEPVATRTLIAMGCVFAAAIIAPPSYSLVTGRTRGEVPVAVHETPVHLADQASRLNLAGNFAAPMDWADYLVWTSEGRLKPLIYGHVHLSRPETFEDYRKVFRGDEVWLHILRNHHVRYLLVSKERNQTLANRVVAEARSGLGHVRIIYQDRRGMIVDVMPQGSPPQTAVAGTSRRESGD